MTALDTSYAGTRFRSRLEARWAVFFDVLGVAWRYEPGGFEVGPVGDRRRYLPDFYLPTIESWVEVKGDGRKVDQDLVSYAVHPRCGLPGRPPELLLLGDLPHVARSVVPWHSAAVSRRPEGHNRHLSDYDVVAGSRIVRFVGGYEVLETLCDSQTVGGYRSDGSFYRPTSSEPWSARSFSLPGWAGNADGDWADLTGPVVTAYEAAATARFEHGAGQRQYRRGEVR